MLMLMLHASCSSDMEGAASRAPLRRRRRTGHSPLPSVSTVSSKVSSLLRRPLACLNHSIMVSTQAAEPSLPVPKPDAGEGTGSSGSRYASPAAEALCPRTPSSLTSYASYASHADRPRSLGVFVQHSIIVVLPHSPSVPTTSVAYHIHHGWSSSCRIHSGTGPLLLDSSSLGLPFDMYQTLFAAHAVGAVLVESQLICIRLRPIDHLPVE